MEIVNWKRGLDEMLSCKLKHNGAVHTQTFFIPGGGQIKSLKQVLSAWKNVNWKSVASTIRYHIGKHGAGKNVFQYTDDAINFFNNNKHLGKDIVLRDGSKGIKIRLGRNQPGGIFTKDGKIVSFWYK